MFPSEDENFGMVVIEAMAHGVPVLATKEVGAWVEVAQYNVGSEIIRDVSDIVGKLRQVAADRKAWQAKGQLARQVAQDLFDSVSVARLMSLALEDVLSGKRSSECRWSL